MDQIQRLLLLLCYRGLQHGQSRVMNLVGSPHDSFFGFFVRCHCFPHVSWIVSLELFCCRFSVLLRRVDCRFPVFMSTSLDLHFVIRCSPTRPLHAALPVRHRSPRPRDTKRDRMKRGATLPWRDIRTTHRDTWPLSARLMMMRERLRN